ncbi:glycoside hydrolase family 76 protein [Nocardia yamanashiensis]|uniref:glycoside hydrolase family 76 protein n=1 Tax=Nocardia yamanashiensis TaxID=209247 RepID=UPI0008340DAE|nr:glycoside hydrolase family 76 protein [Nocardia yamanashiensis]
MTTRTGRNIEPNAALWSERADLAESAIVSRHIRTLWAIPGTQLGVVGWPATKRERAFAFWHYWWQAHLLDVAVDAANRAPTPARHRRLWAVAQAIRMRNLSGWTNNYYDDMAWLAIALERAERTQNVTEVRGGLLALEKELLAGYVPEYHAVPWRKQSDFYNAPANGPTGILLARLGRYALAAEIADFIDDSLRDKETGLIFDGIHLPAGEVETPVYSYCQGVTLGLETELAVHTGEPRHAERAVRLIAAVNEHFVAGGVVKGESGGDGGLFNGILIRYLGLAAVMLPGDGDEHVEARRTAATIIRDSATAAWENRLEVEGEPLFGPDWKRPARLPGLAGAGALEGGSVTGSRSPERDLSVQLSGWMLMEAAHTVTAAGL